MIVPLMGKDPRWLQVEVCREFQRGKCSRTEDECRFAHPPAHVAVHNGRVTACFDSLKDRCQREKCKYLHPPKHLKTQLETNGRMLQHQQQQIAMQHQMIAPLAQQMLANQTLLPGWPMQVPTSNGTLIQQPVAFLPDTSGIPGTPRRLDKSDKLEVCREYQRGACSREESECRYAHPPRHASIDTSDGMTPGEPLRKQAPTVEVPIFVPGLSTASFPQGLAAMPFAGLQTVPLVTGLQMYPQQSQWQQVPTANYIPMELATPPPTPQNMSPPQPAQTYIQAPALTPPQYDGYEPYQYQMAGSSPPQPVDQSAQLPVCRDFSSGQCHREACRYAHITDKNVEIIDGRVTICRDANKGKCEAKNLLPRKEPRSGRNSYCVVSLDQEQVFRTATVEKSLNPFFGEDVHFEVPRDFRSLCFYVYDTDLIGKDTVLGKVAIKKEDLQKLHSDTWFDLVHVHADTEVQGRIHLEIKYFDSIPDLHEEELSSTPKLRIRIKECSDIFACSGGGTFSDSFVTVTVLNPPSRSDTRKTRVKRKTVNPQFDESFLFELPYEDLENTIVRCALWSSTLLGEDVFLGEVRIPLNKCDLVAAHEGWYWLGPREDRRSSVSQQSIGSLRVKICYTEDHVFPSSYYDPMREAILDTHKHQDVTTAPSFILSEVVKDKLSAARSLVRVFSHHNRVSNPPPLHH
ncbi:Ras GTPase-activating protein 3 [Exaiptasia diaphana]|nr:Ras GTPase-activating protein 3 [Exaiptasia diaphana]